MPNNALVGDFVKRFTKLGAIYGFIGGALFPTSMRLICPFHHIVVVSMARAGARYAAV